MKFQSLEVCYKLGVVLVSGIGLKGCRDIQCCGSSGCRFEAVSLSLVHK